MKSNIPNENKCIAARVESVGNANPLVVVPISKHDLVLESHPLTRDHRPEHMRSCYCKG
jgi:hypothetical protein